jgi:DNA-binding CsgD family transcriptional regulator
LNPFAFQITKNFILIRGAGLASIAKQFYHGVESTTGLAAHDTVAARRPERKLSSPTQLNGRSTTSSFDEPVTEADEWGEEFTVNDVLSLNDEDPGQKAARNLDWNALMDSLTERERRLVECLVDGMNWTNAALSMGVSSWTVAADREKLSVKILEFMGVDILAVILKRPGWKNNLNANRERLACKHQRGN